MRIGMLVVVGVLVLLMRVFLAWTTVLVTFFFFLVVSGILFLAYREFSRASDDVPKTAVLGYRLYCYQCGHTWEMTAAEWDGAGLQELQNPPLQEHGTIGTLPPIEWKPPKPWKGSFIVIGALLVALLAAASALGVLWSLSHPGAAYVLIIQISAGIVALSTLTGMVLLFNRRATWNVVLLWILLMSAIVLTLVLWWRPV